MDDYPSHLAPEFEGAAVKTPFAEWWARVKDDFPTVPENVAQYWLHEHWGLSPYGDLVSRNYDFTLEEWPARQLWDIRSCWCRFEPSNVECAAHGASLVEEAAAMGFATPLYMKVNGDFPAPIIVLDNRDGHLPAGEDGRPSEIFLVEGHRRFNIALHLERTGSLRPCLSVWVMKRRRS